MADETINNGFEKEIIYLTPQECLNIDFEKSLEMVKSIIGEKAYSSAVALSVSSPLDKKQNTDWAKTAKIVGINPRLVKTYWGIVKYAMTFPEQAIHIMPLFQTGDGSLYVQNNWLLNDDFLDKNLCEIGFDTSELQLKFVVNILHAMGKIVGFDALAHVDNFSEIVVLNPSYFEWIKLNKDKTAQDCTLQTGEISKEIETLLIEKLSLDKNFFDFDEDKKRKILFPNEKTAFETRMELRKIIRENGYEPVPVVEHAPMRPILFEKIEYNGNENWAVFSVKEKSSAAKIIGSITPYKFFKVENGYPVKNTFDEKVVDYFVKNIKNFQEKFGFDFLRADMAHNQTSHSHNEQKDLVCEEVWSVLKKEIHKTKPYFATFAEAFWGNYYISAIQDMINKDFDIVLGEMNFKYLNESYCENINKYLTEYRRKYSFSPCITVFSNDGDLPEHNSLYCSLEANECRYFVSLFLNLPSYTGMGFEVRNLEPVSDFEYSNPYVKKQKEEFIFGDNKEQFFTVSNMRKLYKNFKNIIDNAEFEFLKSKSEKVLGWYYKIADDKKLFFSTNLNQECSDVEFEFSKWKSAKLIYTNSKYDELPVEIKNVSEKNLKIDNFYIGECVVYEIQ